MKISFAQMHPDLIGEWSEKNGSVTTNDISYGSSKLIWWKCPYGHEWQASAKVRHFGEKCPICSNARIIVGVNDLVTTNPELLSEEYRNSLERESDGA